MLPLYYAVCHVINLIKAVSVIHNMSVDDQKLHMSVSVNLYEMVDALLNKQFYAVFRLCCVIYNRQTDFSVTLFNNNFVWFCFDFFFYSLTQLQRYYMVLS